MHQFFQNFAKVKEKLVCSLEPDLNKGITRASLNLLGNRPCLTELLKSLTKIGAIISQTCLKIKLGMVVTEDILGLIDLIVLTNSPTITSCHTKVLFKRVT